MGNAHIILGGLVFTGAFTVPVFRSGGRTGLTWFEWTIEHTVFGSPVQYVPEEDYIRELEGVKTISLQKAAKGIELKEEGAMYYGTSVAELGDALDGMEASLNIGERAKIRIVSDTLPTRQELNQLYLDLVSSGFHTSKPSAKLSEGMALTELTLRKGSPQWALLIPIIPTVMIVGLVAFGIVKLEAIQKAIMPLLLVAGGTAIAIVALATRPGATRVYGR